MTKKHFYTSKSKGRLSNACFGRGNFLGGRNVGGSQESLTSISILELLISIANFGNLDNITPYWTPVFKQTGSYKIGGVIVRWLVSESVSESVR